MLICNGFELIQKTILFLMTQLHLKQYKKFTVASHGILKEITVGIVGSSQTIPL